MYHPISLMQTLTTTSLQKKFSTYLDAVHTTPVCISRYNKPTAVFLSIDTFHDLVDGAHAQSIYTNGDFLSSTESTTYLSTLARYA
jgi:prevent-host-death family protein